MKQIDVTVIAADQADLQRRLQRRKPVQKYCSLNERPDSEAS